MYYLIEIKNSFNFSILLILIWIKKNSIFENSLVSQYDPLIKYTICIFLKKFVKTVFLIKIERNNIYRIFIIKLKCYYLLKKQCLNGKNWINDILENNFLANSIE